jgi:hypothetical protein
LRRDMHRELNKSRVQIETHRKRRKCGPDPLERGKSNLSFLRIHDGLRPPLYPAQNHSTRRAHTRNTWATKPRNPCAFNFISLNCNHKVAYR